MYGDPIFSVLVAIALWQTIRHNQFEPFFWYAIIGQLLVLTIGGWFVRRWIRNIAARRYEITLDRSTIKVVQISGANVSTRQCHISDVREIRSTPVVSEGEGAQNHPEIVRLDLVVGTGQPIEVLYGRPMEETAWLLNYMRGHLEQSSDIEGRA